jgi:hypothetical protein
MAELGRIHGFRFTRKLKRRTLVALPSLVERSNRNSTNRPKNLGTEVVAWMLLSLWHQRAFVRNIYWIILPTNRSGAVK